MLGPSAGMGVPGVSPQLGRWILLALVGSSGVPSETSLGGPRLRGPREDNLSVILPQAGSAKTGEDDS